MQIQSLTFLLSLLVGSIGASIGLFTLFLLKKYSMTLIEITGVIGSAYLTFYIADFHLSGVIGLATLTVNGR